MLAGAHHERPAGREDALVAAHGVLVQLRHGQVRVAGLAQQRQAARAQRALGGLVEGGRHERRSPSSAERGGGCPRSFWRTGRACPAQPQAGSGSRLSQFVPAHCTRRPKGHARVTGRAVRNSYAAKRNRCETARVT